LADPTGGRLIVFLDIVKQKGMAVTGLVVPYKLETKAQVLFEWVGGFGHGFERPWIKTDSEDKWRGRRITGNCSKRGTWQQK
jgi:hypothetical protein